MISPDDVSAIFARHGVRGAWQALPAYGIANHIFATDDVVLRIATDHPQARPDAYTEIVAAPVARAHGIAVPRLLAFREGEYSLWERVHAESWALRQWRWLRATVAVTFSANRTATAIGGMCVAASTGNMWCAYPDPGCPGGYRYSDQAVGDGVSGTCVPETLGDAGVEQPAQRQRAERECGARSSRSDSWSGGDGPGGLAVGGGFVARSGTKLLVSDGTNNRVLIWNSIPTASGQAADLVLGQTTFATKTHGTSAAELYGPSGVWTDGTHVVVADRFNNRVLIWNSFPTSNGAPADVVLGAASFGTSPFVDPPTASSFRNPAGVAFDGTHLLVADETDNRILVWNGIPTMNNAAASQVLGQSGFDSNFENGGAPYPP